ncbi:MAG: hypothetical protein O7A03_08865 [Alphaproteobacteria bacterium]|nr:hypothetical protein [Alphaproteobacteria bacterium]
MVRERNARLAVPQPTDTVNQRGNAMRKTPLATPLIAPLRISAAIGTLVVLGACLGPPAHSTIEQFDPRSQFIQTSSSSTHGLIGNQPGQFGYAPQTFGYPHQGFYGGQPYAPASGQYFNGSGSNHFDHSHGSPYYGSPYSQSGPYGNPYGGHGLSSGHGGLPDVTLSASIY